MVLCWQEAEEQIQMYKLKGEVMQHRGGRSHAQLGMSISIYLHFASQIATS